MMRSILISAAAFALIAAPAFAANSIVFTVRPGGPTSVDVGTPIPWQVAVDVAGTNQGLSVWTFDLAVVDAGSTPIPKLLSTPNLTRSFNVGGNGGASGASFKDSFNFGGVNASITAAPAQENGKLIGFGGGYAPPWTYTPKADRKTGGIGRADRKADLLLNPAGDYVLHDGVIDTTGLPMGTYTVRLSVVGSPGVLQSGLDLLTNLVGNFSAPAQAGEFNTTSEFTFTLVPEPATLLLLAGAAGAFVRRRRA